MSHFRIFWIILPFSLLFQSCLNDEPDFPEVQDQVKMTESIAVVTLLEFFRKNFVFDTYHIEFSCFEFVYPIRMGYNSGISLIINNEDGLLEALNSQSTGLNVSGIAFPFLVIRDEKLEKIENEVDFLALLRNCNISTLDMDFLTFNRQCFDLNYPVTMIGSDSTSVQIADAEEYHSFVDLQGVGYQPLFVFPFGVEVFNEGVIKEINSYFDLYQVIYYCVPCPEPFFTKDLEWDGSYIFRADFEEMINLAFDWYINGVFIETDGVNSEDLMIHKMLVPGTYEVCIKLSNSMCKYGLSYCETLEVGPYCPDVVFDLDQVGHTRTYEFFARFHDRDQVSYTWVIRKDGQLISQEIVEPQGDSVFQYTFDPGTYEICLETETDECPDVRRSCRELFVDPCPYMDFAIDRIGDSYSYTFTADFPLMDSIWYSWQILAGEDVIFTEPEPPGGDNQLTYPFNPGTYVIRLRVEAEGCPEGFVSKELEVL